MPEAPPRPPRRRPVSYLRSGLYAQPQLPRPDTAVGQVLAERRASLVADLREVVIGFAAWRQATLSARTGSVVMGGRVLVVEDDEATRDSTLALLTSHGYEAVGANSGTTALALLRNGAAHPRLVLLDLHMPGMDGWKFRAELLCDPDLGRIPVVLVSAAGALVVKAAAETMRAAGALVKPFDADELLRVVAALGS